MTGTPSADLPDLLREWLPRQRWYGSKGRTLTGIEVVARTPLGEADGAALDHLLVRADHADGVAEHYQLLVGTAPDAGGRYGHIGGDAYDAVHDPGLAAVLLHRLVSGDTVGDLAFHSAGGPLGDPTELRARVMGVEQSNTSLVYGDRYILKLFRKVEPGTNPDLELGLALGEAGNPHVAAPRGWVEGRLGGEPVTLALLQPFLGGSVEGWAMATASVRDLFAEGDLHADEVGGDFAAEAERLGAATASVHADLAARLGATRADAAHLRDLAARMRARVDAAVEVVDDLRPHADALRAALDEVAGVDPASVVLQRIHGDYHLGQVLRTNEGWVLLDFEGEPAKPLQERLAPDSPLRDVAGMLRSFDYAARHLLADEPPGSQRYTGLAYRAGEWAERNREAFTDGYAEASGADPREAGVLLRAYELDKAVYEVVYEARNRPTWLPVPLGSVARLVGA